MTLVNIDILQRKVNDELKKGMQETKRLCPRACEQSLKNCPRTDTVRVGPMKGRHVVAFDTI